MIGQTDSEYLFHFFKLLKVKTENTELDNLIKTVIIFFSYLNKKNYKISANIIYANKNMHLYQDILIKTKCSIVSTHKCN